MTPFDRHLQAATGFLELGLPHEADEELDLIELEMRSLSEVLAVRAGVYQALQQWAPMETVCQQLCRLRSDEPQWLVMLAHATHRCRSLQDALGVLVQAAMRFPEEPIIFFNLACYQAQLGYLDAARGRLKEAIKLAPVCRRMALEIPTWLRSTTS